MDAQAATVYAPIQDELHRVEERLLTLTKTSIPQLEPLLDHTLIRWRRRTRDTRAAVGC